MSTDTRIESLETQVRTLKRMLFGVFGLVVVGGLLAATSMQSVPDLIQAKRFQVVNGEGKTFVQIGATADGGLLGVINKDGIPVASFGANADGGNLNILNNKLQSVARIGATADGGQLRVRNKDGKQVAAIFADANGDGLMTTHDSKGVVTSRSF